MTTQWILQFIFSETFIISLSVFFLTKTWISHYLSKNKPPGPMGWPVLGHLPMLGKHPHLYLYKLWKKYGDVVQIQMGSRKTIVLNGYKACREALVKQGDIFAGRPNFGSARGKGSIVFETYNENLKLHRSILDKALKRITGSYTSDVEKLVNKEAKELTKELISSTRPQDPRDPITGANARVLFSLICSLEIDNEKNKDYIDMMTTFEKQGKHIATGGNIGDLMPWVNWVTFYSGYRKFSKLLQVQNDICDKYVQSHLETFESNNCRDILDAMIDVTKNTDMQRKEAVGLTDMTVYSTIRALFAGSLFAISGFLHWSVMYLAKYSHIQKKAQKEVDEAFENLNEISYSDRVHVPFVQACILEIMRITTIVPNAAPHETMEDTTLFGYHIPRGTMVIPNLWSISRDESLWNDPEKFDPDRFLIQSGDKIKFDETKTEFVPVLSLGKRRCIGDHLARMEIFIFFVTLLKKCTIQLSDEAPLDFDPVFGLALDPKPYKVLIKPRA